MATYSISRSALIPVPASAIFPLVNDFHEWTKWSPWEGMDPNLSRSYSGPASGVGAKYEWSGSGRVGAGNMEIVGSDEPSRVQLRLEFTKPFKAVNPTLFTFVPEGGATRVTWAMTGENKTFLSKVFALFMNMDKMVGKDFEKGLASLGVEAAKRAG